MEATELRKMYASLMTRGLMKQVIRIVVVVPKSLFIAGIVVSLI